MEVVPHYRCNLRCLRHVIFKENDRKGISYKVSHIRSLVEGEQQEVAVVEGSTERKNLVCKYGRICKVANNQRSRDA